LLIVYATAFSSNLFLSQRNEFKDALDLFERALRSHTDKYGEVHHLVGTALHNCGIVHMLAENYGEAKLCFQGALEVRTAAVGVSHPYVAVRSLRCQMTSIQLCDTPI